MKILIINHYAGSLQLGMEYRPYYLAREWIKMGHTVDIIAADYSHLRNKNPEIKKDFQTHHVDGITYHWIKTGKYHGNGIKRALTMFRFTVKLLLNAEIIAACVKPDVVIASSTYPLDTYPAQRIAKRAKAKLIHEVHDMWPLTLIELGKFKKTHPFVMLLQKAEDTAYLKSDAVVSLLPNTKEYMMAHKMAEEKYHYIPNGIVPEDWEEPEDLPEEHKNIIGEIKRSGKFLICYFGGHALSNALLPFVKAAALLDPHEVCFVLVGQGVEKENLINYVNEKNILNVLFLPPVPKRSIPNLLTYADVLYIGAARSSLYRFGVSMNKLYDAMMSGKPILYAVDAANNDVETAKCGITVEPDNPEAIADAVRRFMMMGTEQLKKLGENGKTFVMENNDYRILARRFCEVFEGIRL